jgi:predicted nucleic acid-binding protein
VDLLKRYFKTIYIVSSQIAEFEKHGAGKELDDLIQEEFVVVAEAVSAKEKERAETLARRIAAQPSSGDPDYRSHLPEAEAIVVTARPELGCTLTLLDELAARVVAEEEGLRITGFPGVVGRAGLDGLLTKNDIRHLLSLCQQQGTHYSNQLIEHVAETYGR